MTSLPPDNDKRLRHLLHIGVAMLLLVMASLAFGAGAPAEPPQTADTAEPTLALQLPPQVNRWCNQGGGCLLVTREQAAQEVAELVQAQLAKVMPQARQEGFVAGYIKGSIDAAKKQGRDGL